MAAITIKQGASLPLVLQFTSAGIAANLTGAVAVSQVRDASDGLIATLAATVAGSQGLVTLVASDTSAWPIGDLRCDVKLTQAGAVTFTKTFTITIERPVTHQ